MSEYLFFALASAGSTFWHLLPKIFSAGYPAVTSPVKQGPSALITDPQGLYVG